MASDAITAIKSSLPPETDYLTYLTILESHLSPEILPTLNEILQDSELTQNIGWDLIQLLIPIPGAELCLNTIARLGNPREVVLKVTEALRLLSQDEGTDGGKSARGEDTDKAPAKYDYVDVAKSTGRTSVDKFCTLVSLLAILHPRIRTKYPSRFLSTSLISILYSYRPSDRATLAIIAFLHSLSGKKRPPLPQRKSSLSAPIKLNVEPDASAPDPEATAEDPQEGAIQEKLLQSFVTHVLEVYIKENPLQWAVRLQEHFEPQKVVTGKTSYGEAFQNEPVLIDRDTITGQLIVSSSNRSASAIYLHPQALSRDLGLSECEHLFEAIYADGKSSGDDMEEEHPSSPDDIPLSREGSLFLVTCFVFSSVIFGTNVSLPPLSIFPGHATLIKQFIGIKGPNNIGTEEAAVIDAILAIGLWLEKSDKFVSGPLDDEDFLQHLQTLSAISANTSDASLRYCAHLLTSSILHAHPDDHTRLTFIMDTLENCPYDTLKASAVGWLKDEIITANERKSENIFSTPIALTAAQPYLFPDMPALASASIAEAWEEMRQSFPFHMAVLNFVYFLRGAAYAHVLPSGALTVAEEVYLGPLRSAQGRLQTALSPGGELSKNMDEEDASAALSEVRLLGERLKLCME